MRGRAGEICATVATCGEDGHVRTEAVDFSFRHVERHYTAARAVLHDEIDREVLDEERRGMTDRLLVKGVEHRVTGTVRRRARSLRNSLAEMCGHTTERSLVNPTLLRPRKRH